MILGKKMLVKNRSGDETNRVIVALGRESATDLAPAIVGDPTVSGATLRVIANGGLDSDQTYELDASGWTALGSLGFKYVGPTGADADPVKSLVLKRTGNGAAVLKTIIKGSLGSQNLDVVPPDPGDEGGLVLSINGGRAYCVQFGGAANSTETTDTGQLWRVLNATAQPGCPQPVTTTTTSTSSTSTMTVVPSCPSFGAACGSSCGGNGLCYEHCDIGVNGCINYTMAAGTCATDGDCPPGTHCMGLIPGCGFNVCYPSCP